MNYFYLARCSDGSLYAGSCKNCSERQKKHNDGKGAKYTRSRRPVKIVYSEEYKTLPEAMRREAQVKQWRREKKENLITFGAPSGKNKDIIYELLEWYRANKRDLPWRKTRDPYKIWVSEIMLQQTQVSRVVDYYERFLKKFPDVHTLAVSTWEDILPYWRGLGFYSRGKNMLRTAQIICDTFGGEFPKNKEDLMRLPGVAEYTSAAILSFAYDEPIPALDTNLKRVIQRVYQCADVDVLEKAKELFKTQKDDAAKLNHAFMDLGSSICKSKRVQCEICPLQTYCTFIQSGEKAKWETSLLTPPQKRLSSTKPPIEVAAACIWKNGKYLIAKRKQLKGGFWEFPGGKREKGEDWRCALKRETQEELGVEISVRPHFFESTWEDDNFFWRIRFFRSQILHGTPKCLEHEEIKWISPAEFQKYDFPPANTKAIQKLKKMRV